MADSGNFYFFIALKNSLNSYMAQTKYGFRTIGDIGPLNYNECVVHPVYRLMHSITGFYI